MKIRLVGVELLHAGGRASGRTHTHARMHTQTHTHDEKLIVAFRHIANAPKNEYNPVPLSTRKTYRHPYVIMYPTIRFGLMKDTDIKKYEMGGNRRRHEGQ